MPDVALGRARWRPEDERHLAACADCRAEWALVAAASRLGERLPAIDPERVAALSAERARRARATANVKTRRIVVMAGLAAAAIVILAVWANRGGRVTQPGGSTMPAPTPIATTPAESLPDTQVQSSPQPSVAQAPPGAPTLDLPIPGLDSLPAEALDSILRTLDEPLAQVGADDLQPDESGDRELEQVLAGMEG
ncbi:MAG TPA: hypothetical protein VJQ46_17900 [Gemmatimonadales bacterium]|nr:hypothetical protein [Gemmatimonadales bacterium]